MKKGTPTRTTNPIHFEDLDPKRFEDLVRELIYDFRDWQTIEATGKGGDDDGFDIRAYERTYSKLVDHDGKEIERPMDGNLWMIQCKREKSIPPSKITKILDDIDPSNPPYGYILAAATNFSKKSYDVFREKLSALGVLEFYLLGNAALETELHQPKNDRILFTFFGISNVRRKQSRATEIRTVVNVKNRVSQALGESPTHKWILARDSKDDRYPYKSKYSDFADRPRWQDYEVMELHPLGIIVAVVFCYGFVDEDKRTFDIAGPSLTGKNPSSHFRDSNEDKTAREEIRLVRDFWERLPRANQAMFRKNGIIRFKDILLVDDKGDSWHSEPHIFVDYQDGSPITGETDFMLRGVSEVSLDGFRRERIFPDVFTESSFGTMHEGNLALSEKLVEQFLSYRGNLDTLYDVDGRYDHLKVGDVVAIRKVSKDERFLQLTHRYEIGGSDLLKNHAHLGWGIREQIGRDVEASDVIKVIEVRSCQRWQWEGRS